VVITGNIWPMAPNFDRHPGNQGRRPLAALGGSMILVNSCDMTTPNAQDHEAERTPPGPPTSPAHCPAPSRFRDHGQYLAMGAQF
jgi:hypothetical protein